jgi:hypothetical protein
VALALPVIDAATGPSSLSTTWQLNLIFFDVWALALPVIDPTADFL